MSAQTATRYISEEEYRDAEETASCKHEWFQGEIYPIPGGTDNHTIIVGNIFVASAIAVRNTNFRARTSEQRVKVESSGLHTYPDAVIFEHPARYLGKGNSTLLTPKVIFEVLSNSTEKYDRQDKFEQYKKIESFTDYILVEQNRVYVEHFSRAENGWLHRAFIRRADVLDLLSVEISLPLDEIYDELELPEPLLTFIDEEEK